MGNRLLLALSIASAGCGSIEYGSPVESTTAYGVSPAPNEVRDSISISVFYRELSGYGDWVPDPRLGRVFVPHDPDYRPYRNGHWVPSGDGLVWISQDVIGWAVCHYGQWTVLEDGRWAWIPGTEWAPAWVDWRESEQYVGWAPMMTGVVAQPQAAWVFVETAYLLIDYVSSMFLAAHELSTVYAAGTPMRYAPNRDWLGRHGVQRARGGRVAVRRGRPAHRRGPSRGGMRVRDPIRGAQGGSVTTRGRGRGNVPSASAVSVTTRGGVAAPSAHAVSVTTRGSARAPLVPAPRPTPRETVVIGAGRDHRGAVTIGAPPRPRSEGPPLRLRSWDPPSRVIAPEPPPARVAPPPRQAPRFVAPPPPPRVVTPAPPPPPRRVVMAPPPPRIQPPPRMAPPPPRMSQPPPRRVVMPPARSVQPAQPPRVSRPTQRRVVMRSARSVRPPARPARPTQRPAAVQPQRRRTSTRGAARPATTGASRGARGGRVGAVVRRR